MTSSSPLESLRPSASRSCPSASISPASPTTPTAPSDEPRCGRSGESPSDAEVVTLVARLVAVKRVDRFLQVAQLLADRPQARFVVVGDGDLRDRLAASDQARSLGARLTWAGFRRDMADVFFASDVIMLTSDHEGTPVSLIEAQAAAVPVVGTDVGGTRSAVRDGESGRPRPCA